MLCVNVSSAHELTMEWADVIFFVFDIANDNSDFAIRHESGKHVVAGTP